MKALLPHKIMHKIVVLGDTDKLLEFINADHEFPLQEVCSLSSQLFPKRQAPHALPLLLLTAILAMHGDANMNTHKMLHHWFRQWAQDSRDTGNQAMQWCFNHVDFWTRLQDTNSHFSFPLPLGRDHLIIHIKDIVHVISMMTADGVCQQSANGSFVVKNLLEKHTIYRDLDFTKKDKKHGMD